MNLVKFPGIGLEFHISKIAFQIRNFVIYKYAVCVVLRDYTWCNTSKN